MSIHPALPRTTCRWELQGDTAEGVRPCGRPAALSVILHDGSEECLCRSHVLEHLNQLLHAFADIPRRD